MQTEAPFLQEFHSKGLNEDIFWKTNLEAIFPTSCIDLILANRNALFTRDFHQL